MKDTTPTLANPKPDLIELVDVLEPIQNDDDLAKARMLKVSRFHNAMLQLPLSKRFTISLVEEDRTRDSVLNALMWAYNTSFCQQRIENDPQATPNYIHGEFKLDVLLPLLLSQKTGTWRHKRAAFTQKVLDHLPNRNVKIAVAFDMVHSHDLGLRLFREYIKAMEAHAFTIGLKIPANPKDYQYAMESNED